MSEGRELTPGVAPVQPVQYEAGAPEFSICALLPEPRR